MKTFIYKFVEQIPGEIFPGILYISLEYGTAVHTCACGCGEEVVTPFSPKDWKLTFDGETVSLRPSIGNWNFKCRSHYWITNNKFQFIPDYKVKSLSDDSTKTRKPKKKKKWWAFKRKS